MSIQSEAALEAGLIATLQQMDYEYVQIAEEDNPLEDFLQTAEETTREDSDPEQAAMAFICKRLKLNYGKLSEEEKKWLKKIAQKSDLLKNPKPQRGRK